MCAALLRCQDSGGLSTFLYIEYPQQYRLIALLGPARRTRPRFSGFGAGPCGHEARQPPVKWPMQCMEASRLKPATVRALRSLWSGVTRQAASADQVRGVWKAHLTTSTSGLYNALLYLRHATDVNSAAAWNDLGAGHLLVFGRTGSADDLASGLESFERALNLEPRKKEARFNRALVLQLLGLKPAAAKEWRDLRAAERGGPWEAEIAGYLDSLSRGSTTGSSPDLGRRIQGERLIADWARRRGKGPEAEHALDQAATVGAELAAKTGDRLLLDSARAAQKAQGIVRAALIQGHERLAAARGSSDYSSCTGSALDKASRRFSQTGSPFGVWARIDKATCDFFAKDFAAARQRLMHILRDTPPGYQIARARASWILGLVELRAGRLPMALVPYQRDLCQNGNDFTSFFTSWPL